MSLFVLDYQKSREKGIILSHSILSKRGWYGKSIISKRFLSRDTFLKLIQELVIGNGGANSRSFQLLKNYSLALGHLLAFKKSIFLRMAIACYDMVGCYHLP